MENYKITKKDIENNYFHFTKEQNLKSIEKMGLVPKIGFHAQALERTKKVFFVQGLDNLLCLLDCWINVVELYPLIPGIYNIGTFLIKYNWFPEKVVNGYFKYAKFNKLHRTISYKYFDHFLKKFVLLNLELEENLDFCFNDTDQIKGKGYNKSYLITAGYSEQYSDLESIKMDKWNLHTFSNVGIAKKKIKLCYINHSYNMKDILDFALKNTDLDIKKVLPVLYGYLKSRNYNIDNKN